MRPEPDLPAATKTPPGRSERAVVKGELYPEHLGPVIRELPGAADEFDLTREELLAGYGYNTARAYWGDLEHWRDWCAVQEPPFDPLDSTTEQINAYLDQMGSDGYSPNTRARRLTAIRALCGKAVLVHAIDHNAADSARIVRRRKR